MRLTVKSIAFLMATILIVGMFIACSQPETEQPSDAVSGSESEVVATEGTEQTDQGEAEKKSIAILLCYKGDEYVLDQDIAFQYYAAQKGWDVYVEDGNLDPNVQVKQIEDAITKKVDAIAIQCMDPEALKAPLEDAVAAGIAVFTFNAPVNGDQVISHIGFDETQNGRNVAMWAKDYIENELGGVAQVAILDLPIGVNTTVKRVEGFTEVMSEIPGVEIVAQQDGQADRNVCMGLAENMLTANPDIDLFFGINYETAAGAAAAIEAAGRTDIVSIAGGWGREMFEVLENDDPILKAMWLQSAVAEAEGTWNAIVDYFDGKTIEKLIYVEPQVPYVTHENVDQIDYTVADRMKEELEAMG